MPQVIALVVAGAGLYAGFKWISRVLSDTQDALARTEAEVQRREAGVRGTPKDLGTLEYDAQSGVYRPRTK
jgi:hypothetical protein